MTPEQRAANMAETIQIDREFMSLDELEEMLLRNIRAAINDKLEEVAKEIELLEEGTYTTAQTPAGLVRAMKVK